VSSHGWFEEIGFVWYDVFESKFLIWIWEPNPIALFLISDLKPVTMAIDNIIIANPIEMPDIAKVIIDREMRLLLLFPKNILRAMNNSVLIYDIALYWSELTSKVKNWGYS
jgi:hypothetical protein